MMPLDLRGIARLTCIFLFVFIGKSLFAAEEPLYSEDRIPADYSAIDRARRQSCFECHKCRDRFYFPQTCCGKLDESALVMKITKQCSCVLCEKCLRMVIDQARPSESSEFTEFSFVCPVCGVRTTLPIAVVLTRGQKIKRACCKYYVLFCCVGATLLGGLGYLTYELGVPA